MLSQPRKIIVFFLLIYINKKKRFHKALFETINMIALILYVAGNTRNGHRVEAIAVGQNRGHCGKVIFLRMKIQP